MEANDLREKRLALVLRLALGGKMASADRAGSARFEPSDLPAVAAEFHHLRPMRRLPPVADHLQMDEVKRLICEELVDWAETWPDLRGILRLSKVEEALVFKLALNGAHDGMTLKDMAINETERTLRLDQLYVGKIEVAQAGRWRTSACEKLARYLLTSPEEASTPRATEPGVALYSLVHPTTSMEARELHRRLLNEVLATFGPHRPLAVGHGFVASVPTYGEAMEAAEALLAKFERQRVSGSTLTAGVRVLVADGDLTTDACWLKLQSAPSGTLFVGDESLEPATVVAVPSTTPRHGYELGLPLQPALGDQSWPLVGREAEANFLFTQYERSVTTAAPSLVCISGPAGVGKTRLIQETAHQLHYRQGATVLYGRCDELATVPFEPFTEALSHLVHVAPPVELRTVLGHGASLLAALAPDLAHRLPGIETVLPDGNERTGSFRALASMLATLSWGRPLLFVVEDAHWADDSTLALLCHLAASTAAARILFLVTLRDGPANAKEARRVREALRRHGAVVESLPLENLSWDGVRELLMNRIGPPHASVIDKVHKRSGGNPLAIRHLLRAARPVTGLPEAFHRALASTNDMGAADLTGLIRSRLDSLPTDCRELVDIATVIGSPFGVRLLSEVAGLDVPAVCLRLDEAVDAEILLDAESAAGQFDFFHPLCRQIAYDALRTSRRAALHLAVGNAILRTSDDDADRCAADLARHFRASYELSGAPTAFDYSCRAGRAAARVLAFPEAAELLSSAIDLAPEAGCSGPDLIALLLEAADAHVGAGTDATARELYLQAFDLARTDGDIAVAVRAVHCAAGPVEAHYDATGTRRIIEVLEATLSLIEGGDRLHRPKLVARLAIERFVLSRVSGDSSKFVVPIQEMNEAIADSQASGDHFAAASTILARLLVGWHPDDSIDARLSLAQEMLFHVSHIEPLDRHLAQWAHAWIAIHSLERGDIAEVLRQVQAMEKLAEGTDRAYIRYPTSLMRTMLALLEGRFDDAAELSGKTYELRPDTPNSDAFFAVQCFLLARERGHVASLEFWARQFIETVPAPANAPFRAALVAGLCDIGRTDDARAALAELAQDDFDTVLQDPPTKILCLAWLCEACHALGATEWAQALYGELLPYSSRNIVVTAGGACLGSAEFYLGLAAEAMAASPGSRIDSSVARDHLTRAIDANRRMGAVPWSLHAEFAFSRLLLWTDPEGSSAEALRVVTRVEIRARALGMEVLATRCTDLKARIELSSGAV